MVLLHRGDVMPETKEHQLLRQLLAGQETMRKEVRNDIGDLHKKVDSVRLEVNELKIEQKVASSNCALKHEGVDSKINNIEVESEKVEKRVNKQLATFQWGFGIILTASIAVGGLVIGLLK